MKKSETSVKPGMTLTELLVSLTISSMIILTVFTLLGASTESYLQLSTGSRKNTTTDLARQVIKEDLEHLIPTLPISLSDGLSQQGWDFTLGMYDRWVPPYHYAASFPAETEVGFSSEFPSDSLGFFIKLPTDLAQHTLNHGKDIAHVLYFTCLTKDSEGEALPTTIPPQSLGYSRKLFRLFTPASSENPAHLSVVYRRLHRIQTEGAAALPHGVIDYTGNPAEGILSVLSPNVAQFNIRVSANLTHPDTSAQPLPDLMAALRVTDTDSSLLHTALLSGDGMVTSSPALTLHHLLTTGHPPNIPTLTLQRLTVLLRTISGSQASTLTAHDWNKRLDATGMPSTGGNFLGRSNIYTERFSFSHFLPF